MPKLRLLDTFCGAGGCAMGYYRAGFEVVGVDIEPQKHYPFEFHQADALDFIREHGHEYDVIHASPPCQGYSAMQHIWKNAKAHPDLIAETRKVLQATGRPYVIENVPGAPLFDPIMICGTMLGLRLIRHRLFECCPSLPFRLMPPCNHSDVFDPWHGPGRTADKFREAFGIDWMPRGGHGQVGTIDQAIPPAYTEWIGRQLMEAINA